jgi:sulfide:quinone oxidoreductase
MAQRILILGGGNAGISTAARLVDFIGSHDLQIQLIEPSDKHFYQPAWTLVGGGEFDPAATVRPEADYIPRGVDWIREKAAQVIPAERVVLLESGRRVEYDWLILAPGIQLNWDAVPGLRETLGQNGVASNYTLEGAQAMWKHLQNFKGGTAIFTAPNTPVKCGGAPQKIMYLASDKIRRQNLNADLHFYTGGGVLFGVEAYKKTLEKVVARYGIQTHFKHNLVRIDGPNQIATFAITDAEGITTEKDVHFDMILVTPPQGGPDFLKSSGLVNPQGFIEVDKATLRSIHDPRIFALGDATNTPNAKTGAAVRKQSPVLVANLIAALEGKDLTAEYTGYGSCPLITGVGKLVLAEFDYTNTPTETFPFDQSKERYSMWLLKKYGLPFLYWNGILQGRM